MKPFLLLQSRPEDSTSDNEHESLCFYGGLKPEQLVRVRMDKGEFPQLNLDDYSGIIMGGGPANYAYHEDEKTPEQRQLETGLRPIMDAIVKADKPFLGICLGVSALIDQQGGKPSFDHGESLSAVPITLTDEGIKDPLLANMPQEFLAIVGHKEGSRKLPKGVALLADTPACVQMIRVGQNVYATQFHPELDEIGVRVRTEAYRHHGYFDPETLEGLVENILRDDPTSSQRIVRTFVARYSQGEK